MEQAKKPGVAASSQTLTLGVGEKKDVKINGLS